MLKSQVGQRSGGIPNKTWQKAASRWSSGIPATCLPSVGPSSCPCPRLLRFHFTSASLQLLHAALPYHLFQRRFFIRKVCVLEVTDTRHESVCQDNSAAPCSSASQLQGQEVDCGPHYVNHAGLKVTEEYLLLPPSQVVGVKACASMSSF